MRIGIVGVTGALGRELMSVLDAAPWRPDEVVALARWSSAAPFVDYGDQQVPVHDAAVADWGRLDGVIVAAPRADTEGLVDRIASMGVPVVDCSGSQLEQLDVPLVVPWLNGEALDAPRERDVVAVPSAVATMLASVLRPLVAAGYDDGADATVMVPASHWGRPGVDELSKQVVALFNSGVPPRRVFPEGFAFDVTPSVGALGASGWSGSELQATGEVFRVAGGRCTVSMMGVPVFSGLSAEVRVRIEEGAEAADIVRVLKGAGLQVTEGAQTRKLPRPRRVEGEAFAQVGRVRSSPLGDGIYLWVSMDNLRATATAAVGCLGALLRQGEGADTDET
jgi:aspartate-semialdehyde dehydrogenase